MNKILKICSLYFGNLNCKIRISIIDKGKINETYKIVYNNEKFILQKLNKKIFKSQLLIKKNYKSVSKHIENEMIKKKTNSQELLNLIKSKSNKFYIKYNNEIWRMFKYINNHADLNKKELLDLSYEYGCAVGDFDNILSNMPIYKVSNTIKNFHNTKKYFKNIEKRVIKNRLNKTILKIIYRHILSEKNFLFSKINRYIFKKTQIVHNDTQYNNILIDKNINKFICLIDYDTIMLGSLYYDYGDCIRSILQELYPNTIVEYSKCLFDFTKGFIESLNDFNRKKILKHEQNNLLFNSIKIITIELIIRICLGNLNSNKIDVHLLRKLVLLLKILNKYENEIIYNIKKVIEMYKKN